MFLGYACGEEGDEGGTVGEEGGGVDGSGEEGFAGYVGEVERALVCESAISCDGDGGVWVCGFVDVCETGREKKAGGKVTGGKARGTGKHIADQARRRHSRPLV